VDTFYLLYVFNFSAYKNECIVYFTNLTTTITLQMTDFWTGDGI